MSQVRFVKLASLVLAPENARAAVQVSTADLEASIPVVGLLQPLNGYEGEGGKVYVEDGGRRLRALQALAKAKKLPAELKAEGVPVVLREGSEGAALRSLASFVREKMHPADEFAAFKALFDQGQNYGQIAAACAVPEQRVRQLLKLVNLHPSLIEAFRAGEFSLDVLQAFTVTDSHERQLSVYEASKARRDFYAYSIKQKLREHAVAPYDRRAKLIGRDAYLAAGGRVTADLFSTNEDETWDDVELIERLVSERLAAKAEALKAEGWAWVDVGDVCRPTSRFLNPEPVELTKEDEDAYESAVATLEDDDADDEARDQAEATVDRLDGLRGRFSDDAKAGAGCHVQLDPYGGVRISRGIVARADAAPGADEGQGEGETAPQAPAGGKPKAADPVACWGHEGHHVLTHVATAAVRHALLADPAKAADVLLAHLAWSTFLPYAGNNGAVTLRPSSVSGAPVRLAGQDEWEMVHTAWGERLAGDFPSMLAQVTALRADEKAELTALCLGASLDATEARLDSYARKPQAWAQLGQIGGFLGVAPAEHWTPDAAFFERGTKATILQAMHAMGYPSGPSLAPDKRPALAIRAAEMAAATKWVPATLQGLIPAAGAALEPDNDADGQDASQEPSPVLLAAE